MSTAQNALVCLSLSIEIYSSWKQVRHTKRRKSITGLSFDSSFWAVFSGLFSVVTSLVYVCSSRIQDEYRRRNPTLVETIPYSLPVLFLEIVLVVINSGWFLQCTLVYKATKTPLQGVSSMALLILALIFASYAYLANSAIKPFVGSVILLDIVDYAWLIGKVTESFRLLPQLSLNWLEESLFGHFAYWLPCQIGTQLVMLFVKFCFTSPWYSIPVNFPTWPQVVSNSLCVLLFCLQALTYRDVPLKSGVLS